MTYELPNSTSIGCCTYDGHGLCALSVLDIQPVVRGGGDVCLEPQQVPFADRIQSTLV